MSSSRKRQAAASSSDQSSSKQKRYDETDLLGLKVSHSESLFKEGQDVILTLKDANVLDNDEDVLENVNLIDIEKANRNVENKISNKTGYNPFDEPEYDSFGRFKKKGLLSKYDEEIEGLKKEAFRIGLDESKRLEQLEEMKKVISKETGEISLQVPKYKIASEYFTEEEIVSFKKPKKSKKASKKSSSKQEQEDKKITADSLMPLGNENGFEDHGSRNRMNNRKQQQEENDDIELVDEAFLEHQNLLQNAIKKKNTQKSNSSSTVQKASASSSESSKNHSHRSKRLKTERNVESSSFVEVKKERDIAVETELIRSESDEDDFEIPDEEIYGSVLEEDDLQRDLMKSLEKARKLKQKERTNVESSLEKISETIQAINEDEMKAELIRNHDMENRSDMVINSTAEFCRNLGDFTTLKHSKQEEELLDFEKDLLEDKEEEENRMDIDNGDEDDYEEKFRPRAKWNEVEFKTEQPKTSDLVDNKLIILEEEPDVSRGLAGALKLSMKKGYLDKEIKKGNISVKASSLEAKNYTIEEKFYDDDKFKRRERYGGSLSEFKDKSNYKPDVKLEYNDDNGRQLSTKEAFRVLSHKFHGKGPGKNKIDKRMKKLQQESKLKSMTSSDTPLQTTRLLQEKQKELHTPYVILSANQNNLLSKK